MFVSDAWNIFYPPFRVWKDIQPPPLGPKKIPSPSKIKWTLPYWQSMLPINSIVKWMLHIITVY